MKRILNQYNRAAVLFFTNVIHRIGDYSIFLEKSYILANGSIDYGCKWLLLF